MKLVRYRAFIKVTKIMNNQNDPTPRSREIFLSASEEVQELIKDVLSHEREVQHMKNRAKIYIKLHDLVRKRVK